MLKKVSFKPYIADILRPLNIFILLFNQVNNQILKESQMLSNYYWGITLHDKLRHVKLEYLI